MLEVMVNTEEPDPPGLRLTLLGLVLAVGPEGVTDVERFIVPAKPAMLLSRMDEVPRLLT